MLKILKEKVTPILAEHRIYCLMDLVDHIYLFHEGRIKQAFSKEEFLSLPSEYLLRYGVRSREKNIFN